MYSRLIKPPHNKSFFLFGPRGTGKTTWIKNNFKGSLYLDFLDSGLFVDLLASPQKLESLIPKNFTDWVVIDEVQRVPALLSEIHRLIESRGIKFVITGSSARKLRAKGTNLLAGRALSYNLYPLTAEELKGDFNLSHALEYGHLPATFKEADPKSFLESYIATYLREEVQQEGLTRNIGNFTRFLEAASFSQGGMVNFSEIARECSVHRKVVENYFSILEDLLIADFLPVFSKRAKRRLISHPKFYFFDAGVYRAVRPKGPLDSPEEITGISLETLIFQELRAINHYLNFGYELFFWRTASQMEVDFVLYGERGIRAFEVKRKSKIGPQDLRGLRAFLDDYPMAKAILLYGGTRRIQEGNIEMVPIEDFLKNIPFYLK